MQVVSVFIAFLAVTSLVVAQSPPGYNYPSPFNQLTPGTTDLGSVPGSNAQQAPQQTSYTGTQPSYNNQAFSPSVPQGPPVFGATPAYNQAPQFGSTASSNLPAASSHSGAPSHSSSAGFPSSQPGFPASATPAATFPHSGSHGVHSGGHSGGHSGHPTAAGTSFTLPSSPGFSGSSDGGSFGTPSAFGNQGGQSGFGAQGGQSNFGPAGGNTQFQGQGGGNDDGSYSGGDYSAIPGTPGVDYPIYTEIPKTSFDCKTQQFPGYYADVEAQCQVFHICALNTTFDFLCPNGTIFSQEHLVCVWWNQFDCNTAQSLYGNNAYIYDYSKTGQASSAQGQSNNFGTTPDSSTGFDGTPQGSGFIGGQGTPGFGATHHSGSHPGSHSGTHSSGFGVSPSGSSAFGSPSSSAPGFGASATGYPSQSAGSGFGGGGGTGFGSSSVPSSGFGQSAPAHSSGFGQSHIPSGGSSHSSSHVPSSHSFSSPAQPSGAEFALPASQPDYQSSVISPTIPTSPATFGVSSGSVTGYPPAGTPSAPINAGLSGEPSREYLPSRRAK